MPPLPPLRMRIPLPPPNNSSSSLYRYYSSAKSHHRPSSSAQPGLTSNTPSTNATATSSLAHDINPPPSTRPADLAIPPPIPPSSPTSAKLSRYVALGRAYLSFYKTGLKNVYHNYRDSVPLRRKLGLPAYLPSSPPLASMLAPPSSPSTKGLDPQTEKTRNGGEGAGKNKFEASIERIDLSRANLQLIRRAAFDLRRLIPFSLLLIICGEMTPLVLLALGSAVTPRTCRVPGQVAKDRRLYAGRIKKALDAEFVSQSGSLSQGGKASQGDREMAQLRRYASLDWTETASPTAVLRACAALGLVKRHDPLRWPVGVWVHSVYRPRLRRYAAYLSVDDALIGRAGGVSAMEAAEVTLAVEERGGVAVADGLEGWDAEREERRWLERWLHHSPSAAPSS